MENKEVVNQPVENQETPNTENENNTARQGANKWMWIVGLALLLIFILTGAWYLREQLTPDTAQDSAKVTQTKTDLDSLSSEVEAMDLGDLEKEFSEVDKDLQIL